MKVRKKIIYTLIAVAFVLSALEVAARLVLPALRTASVPGWMISQHLRNGGLRYDPDLYWYWPELPLKDLEINEFGFRRSKPMTREKPAGVVRVVTLGDSQTMGVFHPQSRSLSGVAEARLGKGWEILNAAVPGFRSLNIYRLLQRRIEAFSPDIVLIDCMAYDSTRDDGPIQEVPLGTSAFMSLAWNSRLLYGLRHLTAWARRRSITVAAPKETEFAYEGAGNHDLIKAWGERKGIKVIFMDYPFMSEQGKLVCLAPPRLLPPGAQVFAACEALKRSGKKVADLFHENNHFTALGNRLVGEALARHLRGL